MARRIWIVCLSLALAGTTLPTQAQDGLLDDLYGRGVHSYFDQRFEEAHGLLTKAITSGLKDPRAHYFRGLTYLRLGRPDEAKAEFTTGAELETIAAEPVNVGKALERIQGKDRLAIEEHRRTARLALHNKAEAAAKARYEERIEAEERVLLRPRSNSAAPGAAPPAADRTDPFQDDAGKPAPLPAAPAEAKPTPPAEPAPAEPKPAEPKPAAADPFADDPKPAIPQPAQPAPAAAAEPPRGSVLGALFRAVKKGAVPSETGSAPEPDVVVPAGDPNAPDPFADPRAKPAPPKPTPPKPAAANPANADPFAE